MNEVKSLTVFVPRFLRATRCWWGKVRYRLKYVGTSTLMLAGSKISRDLFIGDYSFIASGAIIGPRVEIGNFVMFGPGVFIIGDDHNYKKVGTPSIFSGRPRLRPTIIGDDVWVGARCTIMSGITIGDGVIVAAGSVVTKDLQSCGIYAGAPATLVRMRFDEERQNELHLSALRAGQFRKEFAGPKR